MAERQVALVPDDDPAGELRGLRRGRRRRSSRRTPGTCGAVRAPAGDASARARDAGVPIYAGTDAGGYLPHGLVGREIAALAAFSSPAYALGRRVLAGPGLARPPGRAGRRGAGRPGGVRRRPARRPRRAAAAPARHPAGPARCLSRGPRSRAVGQSCCARARRSARPAGRSPRPRRRRRAAWSRPTLTVAGTPEPDGTPVELDATLLTTDPAQPAAGGRAGPRLRRHQGRQPADGPDAGPGRLRGDRLHRPRLRRAPAG